MQPLLFPKANEYILIDFESVQPTSLEPLLAGHYRVMVFVGANQTKLSFDLAAALQPFGKRAEYIRISGIGRNALDFHIAYYMGQVAARDPSASFCIVSKDSGFDPLLCHLQVQHISARRIGSLLDLHAEADLSVLPDQLTSIIAHLNKQKKSKPGTLKTLRSTIKCHFSKQTPSDADVQRFIDALVDAGHLRCEGARLVYMLPE